MNNTSKETKQPTIRVNVLKHGVWAHNGKCGILASTKAEAIKKIKELYPAEYLVIDIAAEYTRRNTQGPKTLMYDPVNDPEGAKKADEYLKTTTLTPEERMEVAAEMSKL